MALAPLVSGWIKIIKARLQNRRGPSLWQVYYDIGKLLRKDSVVSPTASWLFLCAPWLYFATAAVAAALLPLVGTGGDLFSLLYILALGRLFLALASLDAGSAFGGMGGSREMYIAVLVEPVLLLTLLTVALKSGSTALGPMAGMVAEGDFSLAFLFAAIAFFLILIAETGRVPVDNPDTHLELTMIHEGMVLEYSGRFLALIHLAASVKQLVFLVLFSLLFLPLPAWGLAGIFLKVFMTATVLALTETMTNKIRLFKVPGFLTAAGVLSLLALVAQ